MTFNLSRSRGEVLQDMLNACAGRITYQSGQFIIVPGAWVGPSLSLTQNNLIGSIEYKSYLTITDAYNGVKGTFTSAASNWQPTDIPPYCEDELHGYSSGDRWLAADGGSRLWKDVSFPATTSCPTSQRLAKIDLERIRREGRGTLHCDMSAYPAVALDVIEVTNPRWGWTNKTFEVLSSKFVVQSDANGGAPTLGVDLDIAETDSDVFDWNLAEELTPYDSVSPSTDNGQTVAGPQFLEVESGPTTSYVGADGVVIPRILASWLTAPDARVISGGYVRVEYQKVGDAVWTPVAPVGGDQTQCYITGVVSGSQYNVQVQGFTAKGVGSGWAQAGPVTVSATSTSLAASSVTYPDGTPVANLQPAQAGADVTGDQPIVYTGAGANIVPNGNFLLGNIKGWSGTAVYGSGGLLIPGGSSAFGVSPTFSVVPGHKYRITFTGQTVGSGTITAVQRIIYSATYSPNITSPPYLDLDFSAPLTSTSTTYTYDWTCPAGVYFASLAVYQLGTAELLYTGVAVYDYAAAAEWGADVTSANTSANTSAVGTLPVSVITGTINPGGGIDFDNPGNTNQGDLSKIDQANTQNIVAGAVNASIAYNSTDLLFITKGVETVIGEVTISTDGGYVKLLCTTAIAGTTNNPGTPPQSLPFIRIYKGAMGGTVLNEAAELDIANNSTSSYSGYTSIAIQALDDSPALAQQYTVTAESGNADLQCDWIAFLAENAKV
jgi:hypothetical protein